MLTLLWEAIIGMIVGAVAKLLMPGKDPGGIWVTMILGIAGSIVATYLGKLVGWYREGQAAGFIMSVVGAILLLIVYRVIRSCFQSLRKHDVRDVSFHLNAKQVSGLCRV
jgi:uncharacterized membrane protein YeaQ/YmgE (transglycosylase-associated protein family)